MKTFWMILGVGAAVILTAMIWEHGYQAGYADGVKDESNIFTEPASEMP